MSQSTAPPIVPAWAGGAGQISPDYLAYERALQIREGEYRMTWMFQAERAFHEGHIWRAFVAAVLDIAQSLRALADRS